MKFSIKLTVFATLLILVVAGILSYTILIGQAKTIQEDLEANRFETIRALRLVAREAILVEDDTDMVNYVNLFNQNPRVDYAMVLDPEGIIRVHTDPVMMRETLRDPATQKSLEQRARQTPFIQRVKSRDGRDILDYTLPIMIGINPAQFNGIVRIGFDQKAYEKILNDSLQKVKKEIGKAFVYSLLIGLAGAVILALFITRPIQKLKDGARIIGQGKLNHRIRVRSKDELGDLANEFNLMAQRLGELDQMKQDFVSNVTHELRSPLTSIRGYLDLFFKGDAGPLTSEQTDFLTIIKNSTVRLSRFIDNLLDVAKIEAHRLKLTPEPYDLQQLGREMAVLFKPQLAEKKIKFINTVTKSLPPAFVDKDKLAEVLINLTSNAIKFTPEGGQVTFSANEGSNYLEIQLADTGAGIPPDMQARLFNKFVQVKSSQGLARQQKGTGLGLAIVKGIIEAHGGKIWIESPAPNGKGSVFHFTVPKLTNEIKEKLHSLGR